jgi:hypothetical protein
MKSMIQRQTRFTRNEEFRDERQGHSDKNFYLFPFYEHIINELDLCSIFSKNNFVFSINK